MPEAAKLAEQWAERVVVGNADDPEPWDLVDDESFDVVTFGDVLEHLGDPLGALRRAVTKLKPAGLHRHVAAQRRARRRVGLSLLRGAFRYSETRAAGPYPHAIFHAGDGARASAREAGLVVVDTERVVGARCSTPSSVCRGRTIPRPMRGRDPGGRRHARRYQFVMKSVSRRRIAGGGARWRTGWRSRPTGCTSSKPAAAEDRGREISPATRAARGPRPAERGTRRLDGACGGAQRADPPAERGSRGRRALGPRLSGGRQPDEAACGAGGTANSGTAASRTPGASALTAPAAPTCRRGAPRATREPLDVQREGCGQR